MRNERNYIKERLNMIDIDALLEPKNKYKCPECSATLIKNHKDGMLVKRCPECKRSWFIVKCRESIKREKKHWKQMLLPGI